MPSKRHGWFKIDGVQGGDRTLEQQLKGLSFAIEECRGKSVLDIGCAEGLISKHFLQSGAAHVFGMDVVEENIYEATQQCTGLNAEFWCGDVQQWASANLYGAKVKQFDIVLALAVLHKFRRPQTVAKWMAASCANLMVIRYPGKCPSGIIIDPRSDNRSFNVPQFMGERGFVLERETVGPLAEMTAYFRKK